MYLITVVPLITWFASYPTPAQISLIAGTALCYFFADAQRPRFSTMIGVVACTLLALAKFNDFIIVAVMILLMTVNDIGHRRLPTVLVVATDDQKTDSIPCTAKSISSFAATLVRGKSGSSLPNNFS